MKLLSSTTEFDILRMCEESIIRNVGYIERLRTDPLMQRFIGTYEQWLQQWCDHANIRREDVHISDK